MVHFPASYASYAYNINVKITTKTEQTTSKHIRLGHLGGKNPSFHTPYLNEPRNDTISISYNTPPKKKLRPTTWSFKKCAAVQFVTFVTEWIWITRNSRIVWAKSAKVGWDRLHRFPEMCFFLMPWFLLNDLNPIRCNCRDILQRNC